jgi:DNA-binding beta-propeller fold protein YncE
VIFAPLGLCLLLCSCASQGGPGPEPGFIFYPAPPVEPRIQFLATFTFDTDVLPPMTSFERFVLGERMSKEIGKPYGVAIHDGEILVCDTRGGVVEIFDLRNRSLEILGRDPSGQLRKPVNIAVDEDGTRYVADTDLKAVMVYDRENRFVRALGDPEELSPTDVAIAGERLYVVDVDNGQVVVLEKSSGRELRHLGGEGSGEGEMLFPTNIEIDADENVYVVDTGDPRVLKFDSRGKLLRQFGSLGKRLGQFVRPKGVAVDLEGRVYVVDAAFANVQIFDPEGELLLFFGSAGSHAGGLNVPAKVEIDYDNVDLFADHVAPGHEIEYLILVTSQFGVNKVNAFGFLKQSE